MTDVIGLNQLVGEVGKPQRLTAQGPLGLAVDTGGALEGALDEGAGIGIVQEVGGVMQAAPPPRGGASQAGSARRRSCPIYASVNGDLQLAAGTEMRSAMVQPIAQGRPAGEQGLGASCISEDRAGAGHEEPDFDQGLLGGMPSRIGCRIGAQRLAGGW